MIRNRRRTISAEDNKIIEDITGTSQENNNTPTLNQNKDIILNIKKRNFWSEEKENDISNTTIKIPLAEYVTRKYLSDNYYNKTQINDFIENYGKKVVILDSRDDLPQEGDEKYGSSSYIFFVQHEHMAGSNDDRDIYDEYIWDSESNNYERIGNTDIDLSDYLETNVFNTFLEDEYEVRLENIRNSLRSRVTTETFNTTINNLSNTINTKTSQSDVETIVTNKISETIQSINTELLK